MSAAAKVGRPASAVPVSPMRTRPRRLAHPLCVPLINLGRGACGARPAAPSGHRWPPSRPDAAHPGGQGSSGSRPPCAHGWCVEGATGRAFHGARAPGFAPNPHRPRSIGQTSCIRSAGVQFIARPGIPGSAVHGAPPHTPLILLRVNLPYLHPSRAAEFLGRGPLFSRGIFYTSYTINQ